MRTRFATKNTTKTPNISTSSSLFVIPKKYLFVVRMFHVFLMFTHHIDRINVISLLLLLIVIMLFFIIMFNQHDLIAKNSL